LLDLGSDLLEVRGAIWQKRGSAHSGQIDDKAPEMVLTGKVELVMV
jgi:hypothetical protein